MRKGKKWYYIESFKEKYHRAKKKEKGVLLDEFCRLNGYERKYATRLLSRKKGVKQREPLKRGRRSKYDSPEFVAALKKLWMLTEQMCSKLLKEAIPLWLPSYESNFGLSLSGAVSYVIWCMLSVAPQLSIRKVRTGTGAPEEKKTRAPQLW